MDKQRQLMLKLENLDDEFNRKRRQLDEAMDDASQEKWRFNQELESLLNKSGISIKKEIMTHQKIYQKPTI